MSDKRISVEAIRKGDAKAFRSFFEDFYVTLCQIANSYLKDADTSRDIAQEAFVCLWEKRSKFYSVPSAKFYLYKYVRNRSLNHKRDARRRDRIIEECQSDEIAYRNALIEQETYQLIHQAIKNLPLQGQKIIELSLDGLTNPQIAEELKVSVNTVKTHKKRAYKNLRDDLKENVFILFSLLL